MDELTLLREFGADVADADELSQARAKAALRASFGAEAGGLTRPSPSRWFRWLRVAAVSVALGAGVGFGLATWLTPAGSATSSFFGFGFLPSKGWTVVQSGTVGATGTSHAIAANVPIDASDDSSVLPYATLRRLPARGAVVVARLSPRGDERTDSNFPLRTLPLRMSDAVPEDLPSGLSETSLVSLRVRGGVAGYNVDARVFLGASPSPQTVAAVDAQLRRLIVAPRGITLVVQPQIIRRFDERLTIFGSVSSGKADQKVTVQFKACGLYPIQFRDAFETTTREGGGYTLSGPGAYRPPTPGVSGVFRAVSGDSVSAEVRLQQRASISLRPLGGGRAFRVSAGGKVSFWRKVVLIQRFERRRGVWITMRRLALSESYGSSGAVATVPFRPAVPKRTLIRAVLPLSQARPCYLAGYSRTWRT